MPFQRPTSFGTTWRWCVSLALFTLGLAAAQAQNASLHGHVEDENGLPVAGAEVGLQPSEGPKLAAYSDAAGNFEISALQPGSYHATVSKPGFFLLKEQAVEMKQGPNDVSFSLSHEYEVHESVEVMGAAQQVEPVQTAQQQSLEAHQIVDLPLPRTHDLAAYLPSIPGVLRDNSGGIHVAGGRAEETQYLLDGFEISDPATGLLTTRMNVDAVRSVDVDSGGFGAQYPHGGSGVLAVNTQTGDDHWRFGTTNFLPGVSIQQGWNLGNWYPRFTLSGPIRKGRAWLSDSLSLQHTFSVVSGLSKPANTVTQWAGDNLLRAQFNVTSRHILQADFLINRLADSHLGLSAFSPLSTTTDLRSSRYFISLKDQIAFESGLLELGAALDTGRHRTLPQGSETYIVAPQGASGNYFERLDQRTRRWQTNANLSLPSRRWHGSHDLSMGFNADHAAMTQQASRSAIETQDASGTVRLLTTFSGSPQLHLSNTQAGGYAQDTWRPLRAFVIQAGGRADWNAIIGRTLWAPRMAANWIPFADNRAKLTLHAGVYYQPVELALLAWGRDQSRVDLVNFSSSGPGADPPALSGPFVSRFLTPGGLEQPRFRTASVGWQERFGTSTFVSIGAILRQERNGLAYQFVPSPALFGGEFLLQNNRRDQYRSIEVSLRRTFGGAEVFADYMRSRARSNQALDYTLGSTLFSPQISGELPWDAPNRFLSYGWTPTRLWGLFPSYYLEYRTGYPFSRTSILGQLLGPPYLLRFPPYLSLDVGVEKRFHFHGHQWALRITAINVTAHRNPDAVANLGGGPNGFAGGQGRAFTGRLRLVGKK
jgi:carboxypeptidase family protein